MTTPVIFKGRRKNINFDQPTFSNLDKLKDCGMIINNKVFTIVQDPYLNRELQPAMNGSNT